MSNPFDGVLGYEPEEMAELVADHLQRGLRAYIETGQPVGDGLRRVICDEPVSIAVLGLDKQAFADLPGLIRFLHNYAPAACWGSKDAYDAWREQGGLQGHEIAGAGALSACPYCDGPAAARASADGMGRVTIGCARAGLDCEFGPSVTGGTAEAARFLWNELAGRGPARA